MKYYFIYSAGGGGGEWDGVKRIWNSSVKPEIKDNILLKFGDIFFNHRKSQNLIRPHRWRDITNVRSWIADATNDRYVHDSSQLFLDSGSAKIVSWLSYHHGNLTSDDFIRMFNDEYETNNILEKYSNIVIESNINKAVSLDIPNPFKVRSQGADNRLSLIERDEAFKFIDITAKYANELHNIIGDRIMTVINGMWTIDELNEYLEKLTYTPRAVAIGGLSNEKPRSFEYFVNMFQEFGLHNYDNVHFLGCAGIKKLDILKTYGYNLDKFSADCSTPINRSFSDGISNYYFYNTGDKIKILEENRESILASHSRVQSPYFSYDEMSEIIDLVLTHQQGREFHTHETFNARAKLMLHNSDVFRHWANR